MTRRPRRWIPARCGFCSRAWAAPARCATPTLRRSASPATWEYNSASRGLFRDLRRHLDRAWTQHTGADPFLGDLWQVALLDLQPNASRRWPATQGVIDFRGIEPVWLREIVKDWARATRPNLQRLRETLRACQAASHALTTAGRLDPTSLGAGEFTHIIDTIAGQRRSDGTLYSAQHRNLLLYQFCQVIEHGRASGLMAEVPDPFRPAHRHRIRDEPNEDELGKALPESVISQLDARLHLLGPAGRAGAITPAHLQQMHQTIYQILRDTGRRPGEVVSLHADCIEVIDGQHNLIYDNHKAGRMRRRLPITTHTAEIITAWRQRRGRLSAPPALDRWLFPTPLLRAHQSRGHVTPACVCRAFKAWVGKIGVIDGELLGPDGAPAPFDPSLITPYALRHCYVISPALKQMRHVCYVGLRPRASRVSGTCRHPRLPSPRDRVDQRWVPGRAGSVASSWRRVVGGARR